MKFEKAVFESSFGLLSQLPKSDVAEIVFSGRSNVGKSSLINKLLNRKSLAKVSSTPGKTTTINFYNLEDARFVDLPGYGYAKRSNAELERWSELINGYLTSNRNIKLIVQLIDMRHSPTKQDIQMLQYLDYSGYNFIVVLTKSDKLKKSEFNKRLASIDNELSFLTNKPLIIPVSSIKGDGIENLKEKIVEYSLGN